MANNTSGHTKKYKLFFMVLNYIKEEQIALGQIEARKIYGKLNNAEIHIHQATPLLKIREYGSQDRPYSLPPTTILPARGKYSWMSIANRAMSERGWVYWTRSEYLLVQNGERSISIVM